MHDEGDTDVTYQQYREVAMGPARLRVVDQAVAIANEYTAQGYDLTLRQLYYQFVARDLIPNRQQEYKRLGDILNDARLGGLFPWDAMVDRTREEAGGDAGDWTPQRYLRALANSYSTPYWTDQDTRVEVWVEKEALAGVVERAATARRVTYFSCRGYTSASSMWHAAQRLERYLDTPGVDSVVILHLGDHDPSGIDMTRDITDRLDEFLAGDGYESWRVQVKRIALNMDQVQQYNPPPNPAKLTDSRVDQYIARFGMESWELDALDPATLGALIDSNIAQVIDPDPWDAAVAKQAKERAQLVAVANRTDLWDVAS